MIKLLVLADDFTGAFDTGIQFVSKGAITMVITQPDYDFSLIGDDIEVLVLVTETRHLAPKKAYERVFKIVQKAIQKKFSFIYLKTDSALRGNIGSELAALMDASDQSVLAFIPALPKLNRITRLGIHYIDGVPVEKSVFGKDPFEPVLESKIEQILKKQTAKPVVLHNRKEKATLTEQGIHVFDAETDADLEKIGNELGSTHLHYCAGCSGFAPVLSNLIGIKGCAPKTPLLKKPLLIVCGSVNPVTISQMKSAEKEGFSHIHLTAQQKLDPLWSQSKEAEETIGSWVKEINEHEKFILDVNDPEGCDETVQYAKAQHLTTSDCRVRISNNLAILIKKMLDQQLDATLLCTGGDTLLALMKTIGISELIPLQELETGVVLTQFQYHQKRYYIISKSGGFGHENLFIQLSNSLLNEKTI